MRIMIPEILLLEISSRSEYDLSFYAFVNNNASKWKKIRTDCYVNGKSTEMMGLKDVKRKNARKRSVLKILRWKLFVLNMRDAMCFKNGFFVPLGRTLFHSGCHIFFLLETFKEQLKALQKRNF